MSADPKPHLDVDAFLAWSVGRDGRHELHAGEVVSMAPERVRHADAKFAVQSALRAGIRRAGLPCRMMPDGMTVRIDRETAYEPDALVYCGARLDPDAVEVPAPVVVVEVLSPGTSSIDTGAKLIGYFRLHSVQHYLIVDPVRKRAIHHRRLTGDLIETRIVADGLLALEPPGLSVPVSELFEDL